MNPAAVSAADGSLGLLSDSVNGEPARVDAGAVNVAVGATFVIVTVALSIAVRPPSSVTRTRTVRDDGPSSVAAENVGVRPDVSNVPLSSRSHAYISGPPSGSLPVAASPTLLPSSTLYGPPAATVGGWFNVTSMTDGSWSDAWSANSAFTCTTSKTSGSAKSASLTSTWSSTCAFPSN